MGSVSSDHTTVLDRRTSGVGLVVLVAANLLVALLAVRHRWGYYETLLIYWAEVAILGGYNVLRLLVVGVFGAVPFGAWAARYVDLGSRLNRLALTLVGVGLFVVKFGTFVLVIGLFLYRTTIGAVHRKLPQASASVPCFASLGSIEMVNFSIGLGEFSDPSRALPRSCSRLYSVPHCPVCLFTMRSTLWACGAVHRV